jgi:NMD protein affecting ribosome stability and mRNA decay
MARNLRYMETGVCALCGAGVHLDDKEGRVVCDGCDKATDNCICMKDDLDTRHESSSKTGAMRPGTSGQWIADPQPEDVDDEDDDPDD